MKNILDQHDAAGGGVHGVDVAVVAVGVAAGTDDRDGERLACGHGAGGRCGEQKRRCGTNERTDVEHVGASLLEHFFSGSVAHRTDVGLDDRTVGEVVARGEQTHHEEAVDALAFIDAVARDAPFVPGVAAATAGVRVILCYTIL